MAQVQIKDIKENDKILIDNEVCVIKDIKTSAIGKHGKVKRRIEAINPKNNELKIIVRLSEDSIEVPD